jgi:ABC-type uncharacterized transport system auxiliary subunit
MAVTADRMRMRQRAASPCLAALALAAALAGCGCRSQQEALRQQRDSLTSLRSTTAAVCDAWLRGKVSKTYVRTTLEATKGLLDKDRAEVASLSPDVSSDPAVRALGDAQGRLARALAVLRHGVDTNDPTAVRMQLSAIAARPQETR